MEVFDVYIRASAYYIMGAESKEEAEEIIKNIPREELIKRLEIDEIEISLRV